MTTREAFENWAGKGLHLERIPTGAPFAGDYRNIVMQTRWDAWQAATAAALDRAAGVCDELAEDYLAKYLASQATRQQTNLDYLDGASDAAEICTAEIRALKEQP